MNEPKLPTDTEMLDWMIEYSAHVDWIGSKLHGHCIVEYSRNPMARNRGRRRKSTVYFSTPREAIYAEMAEEEE